MKQLTFDYLNDLQECLDETLNLADFYGKELPIEVIKSLAVINKFLMKEISLVEDNIRKEFTNKR